MSLARMIRFGILVLCSCVVLAAQDAGKPVSGQATHETPAPQTSPSPTQPSDDLAQIRDDLNRMESLNMNMSSEIEFLHDQNLQILLRTNSQMWTVLLRDMRRQLERDEQRRPASPGVKK